MLSVKNLSFSYERDKLFFNNINIQIPSGEITAIIGANGCGKTTLLKNIARQLKPKTAFIYYNNLNLLKLSNNQRARLLSYMTQHTHKIEALNALDIILLGRKPYIRYNYTDFDYKKAEYFSRLLKLDKLLCKDFTQLSGGEKQRVLLAKALMQEPNILLLDEPNNHLDPKAQMQSLQLVKKVCEQLNLVVLIVLHDINLALRFAKNIICMKNAKILATLKQDEITQEDIQAIFDLPIEIVQGSKYKSVIFNPENINLLREEHEY